MPNNTTEITGCEVCGATSLMPALNLGPQPLCDDLVAIGDTRQCLEYPVEVMFCGTCATAHQRFQVPKHTLFPRTYHYRARFTADVLNGMKALVASAQQRLGSLAGKKVLDVGCNDGSLLDFFREQQAVTYGIEPTDASRDALEKGHTVIAGFFDMATATDFVERYGQPDIVTFTNVFAHIENLPSVLDALRVLMHAGTVLIIENHYLGSILDRDQFDSFYHEHPRTYSYTSFEYIARSLDVTVAEVEFPSRYGGNIRVYLARPGVITPQGGINVDDVRQRERQFGARFARLQSSMEAWRAAMRQAIVDQARRLGPLRAKSFPARAAVVVRLLGLDTDVIAAIHEKPGSLKLGHYVPGTRIPIVSDDELFALEDQSRPLLNFAWHISAEIRAYLTANGYKGPVIDVLDPKTFNTA
jgi:D-mycarose 3-C-methyltransferase